MTGWVEIQNGWGEIQTPSGGSSLPDLTGNTGKVLTVNAGETGTEWAVGPAPAAAGSDTQVLFNDGGAIAGDAGLTFDKTTNGLSSTGPLTLTPAADVVPLTARAYSSGTGHIAQFQTSANGALSHIAHDGTFVGNVTGNVSGTSGSTTGNAATATAVASVVASKLVGRGSAAGDGASQDITVGTGLTMTGTTLSATGGGGGITNSAGANVVVKSDGTNVVATALSEASAGAFATSAGTALGFTATAPAATTGASQVGKAVTITASPAVASTDTAGAAAGGAVTVATGAAARNTSGAAAGGNFNVALGAGIGGGTRGYITANGGTTLPVVIGGAGYAFRAEFESAGTATGLLAYSNNTATAGVGYKGVSVGTGGTVGFTSGAADNNSNGDVALARAGAGVVKITNGGTDAGGLRFVTTNGASWTQVTASELITLSTAGTTTDSSANLLPANAVIRAVVCRVTTEITTATDWSVGDATVAARFAAANNTMTAGAASVGLAHVDQTGTSGPRQTSAAKVRITTTGTPGAGVIRCTVFADVFVAPTS